MKFKSRELDALEAAIEAATPTDPTVVLKLINELRQAKNQLDWVINSHIYDNNLCPKGKIRNQCKGEDGPCCACWHTAASEATRYRH